MSPKTENTVVALPDIWLGELRTLRPPFSRTRYVYMLYVTGKISYYKYDFLAFKLVMLTTRSSAILVVNRRTAKRFVSTAITSFGRTKNTVFIVEVVFFLKLKAKKIAPVSLWNLNIFKTTTLSRRREFVKFQRVISLAVHTWSFLSKSQKKCS